MLPSASTVITAREIVRVAGVVRRVGEYLGDSTGSRGIAHGGFALGNLIVITRNDGSQLYIIKPPSNDVVCITSGRTIQAVTAPDDTNFYVGNGASYSQSANETGITYTWVMYE